MTDQNLQNDISYQNKDIVSKEAAEYFKNKSLSAYGLDVPRIVDVRPTNLPAIEANELRIDNLFEFEDGSIGIIDYESSYKNVKQKIKYLNYVIRILHRYQRDGTQLQKMRVIIIYTADVERKSVTPTYDIGCLQFSIEMAFLSELDVDRIAPKIRKKIMEGIPLDEEEQMQFVILPLAMKNKQDKINALHEGIELSKKIKDEEQGLRLLASMVVFADKIIDEDTSSEVRGWIQMTKVARIFEEEKKEAIRKLNEQYEKALGEKEEEKEKALKEKEEEIREKEAEIREKEEEKEKALREKEEEKEKALKEKEFTMARNIMLNTDFSDNQILGMLDILSMSDLRQLRKKLA